MAERSTGAEPEARGRLSRDRGWLPADPGVPAPVLRPVLEGALREDLAAGDLTSGLLLPRGLEARSVLVARRDGVAAGLAVAALVFRLVDESTRVELLATDGDALAAGSALLRVAGDARSLLAAERTALNFVQRLSGIATLTASFVAAVAGTGTAIADTRKTTPGLRALEKYAVRCGGGRNHRSGLGDAVLVKDNHRAALLAAGVRLSEALRAARKRLPHSALLEVEVESEEELEEALAGGADAVLLDNRSPAELRRAVERVAGRALVEASGGVTLETVRALAQAGPDLISVGALTHSAPALDVSLEWEVGPAAGAG